MGAVAAGVVCVLIIELEEEELLKLETCACGVELDLVFRVVDGFERLKAWHEVETVEDFLREGLVDGSDTVAEGLGEACQRAGPESVLLHLVGGVIYRQEGRSDVGSRRLCVRGRWSEFRFQFWMGHLPLAVVERGLADDGVFDAGFELAAHPFGAGEPYELDGACAVGEVDCQPFTTGACADDGHVAHRAAEHDEGRLIAEGGDGGCRGAVDVTKGEVLEQVEG